MNTKDFWNLVDKTNTCWIWKGTKDNRQYGQCSYNGKRYKAHRLAYELSKGPIPQGLTIDHLCYNPLCVNPDHLEAVTLAENQRRKYTPEGIKIRSKMFSPRIVNTPGLRERMFSGISPLSNQSKES